MGLSLGAPWAAIGLLSLPAILALYLLRVRRTKQRVPSLRFWPAQVQELHANAPWQRLRPSWILAAQLAAALLLSVCAMQPELPAASELSEATVVMLDGSGSMQATDVGPSRFAAAVARAQALIDQMGSGQQVALVQVDQQPRLLSPLSSDRGELRAALSEAKAGSGEGDLGAALEVANAILSGHVGAEIRLLSDGHLKVPAETVAHGRFVQEVIGHSSENVAIEALTLEAQDRVFIRLTNHGDKPATGALSLSLDNRALDILPYSIDPHGSQDLSWQGRLLGAVLRAQLQPGDAFALDDVAYLTVQAQPRKALLVSAGNPFLYQSLKLWPGLEVDVQAPGGKLASGYDLYVFDGWYPDGPAPAGAQLVVNPPEGKGPLQAGAEQVVSAVFVDPRSQLLMGADVRSVHVARAKPLKLDAGYDALLSSPQGALAALQKQSQIAVFGFDLHDSDLVLKPAFPLLVRNLLTQLLPGAWEGSQVEPGTAVRMTAGPGVKSVQVTDPLGRKQTVAAGELYNATQLAGGYQVREVGGAGRVSWFSVSFSDPVLSEIAPQRVHVREDASAGNTGSGRLELWKLALPLLLLLLLGEWWLYWRRA